MQNRSMGEPVQPGGYQTYRRVQTETATPAELVTRLYEALMRDLQRAEQHMPAAAPPPAGGSDGPSPERAHSSLVHAQDIILELLASLDMNAGDIAQHLSDLYQYMYGRLVQANVSKDRSAVTEVITLLRPIHAAWNEAVRAVPAAPAPEPRRLSA